MKLQAKPVGQRPCCLQCARELRPNYKTERVPTRVNTGEIVTRMETVDFYTGRQEERSYAETRVLDDEERKQWRKDHPPEFLGTYGDYGDNRFCGLRCGYYWAVNHSREAK